MLLSSKMRKASNSDVTLKIFGVHPVEELDRITALAARLLRTTDVVVNLVGDKSQFYVSSAREYPLEMRTGERDAICASVVWKNQITIISDLESVSFLF